MSELHEILAVEKGIKPRSHKAFTDAYHQLAKSDKLSGISRTYRPKDDEGDQLPPESTRLQLRATDAIDAVKAALVELFDVTATKDVTNQEANADIFIDNRTLASNVPVSTLLFLEKQLVDLTTFISKLPVLDPGEEWAYDDAVDAYSTSVTTTRTKKTPRNHIKAAATDKHPAQVDVYFEDVLVGYWTTTKFSGALPAKRVNELKARVARLSDAVKVARELANKATVQQVEIGDSILGYLFA